MGKYLDTDLTDRIEIYLISNNISYDTLIKEKSFYKYLIWNNKNIQEYNKELGVITNSQNIEVLNNNHYHLDNDKYSIWLEEKYINRVVS